MWTCECSFIKVNPAAHLHTHSEQSTASAYIAYELCVRVRERDPWHEYENYEWRNIAIAKFQICSWCCALTAICCTHWSAIKTINAISSFMFMLIRDFGHAYAMHTMHRVQRRIHWIQSSIKMKLPLWTIGYLLREFRWISCDNGNQRRKICTFERAYDA